MTFVERKEVWKDWRQNHSKKKMRIEKMKLKKNWEKIRNRKHHHGKVTSIKEYCDIESHKVNEMSTEELALSKIIKSAAFELHRATKAGFQKPIPL